MEKSIVALVPCGTYEDHEVIEAVRRGLSLLGGADTIVARDEKILLKLNLLGKAHPQRAMTTHPAVFRAVARVLQEEGFPHIAYGDSPGNAAPLEVAKSCGVQQVAEELHIPLSNFEEGKAVPYPQGRAGKSYTICQGVLEADALINLCKMKTHALERITGGVKNIYGCVPGFNKKTGHARHPNAVGFAHMLADLNGLVKPRLHVMDGVMAMEGNGPSAGTPVNMGVLLFSKDPVALDSVFCHLVHLPPHLVPTNVAGAEAGLGHYREEEIEVRTPEGVLTMAQVISQYGNAGFQVHRDALGKGLPLRVLRLLPALSERPKVDPGKCIRCGICVESCPVEGKAVFLNKKTDSVPRYDYRKCIRCYCCQEHCASFAISVQRPLERFFGKKK